MFTRVVIEDEGPGDALTHIFVVRVVFGRRDRKHKWFKQVGDHSIEHDLIVEFALQFRFAQGNQFIGIGTEEQLLLEIIDDLVGDRIGVGKRHREITRQRVAHLPHHRGQKIGLPAGGRADNRGKQRWHFICCSRNPQTAARAGHIGAAQAGAVDGVPFRCKLRGEETLLGLRAEDGIADQVLMPGDVKKVLNIKFVPAVRTNNVPTRGLAGFFGDGRDRRRLCCPTLFSRCGLIFILVRHRFLGTVEPLNQLTQQPVLIAAAPHQVFRPQGAFCRKFAQLGPGKRTVFLSAATVIAFGA